MSKNMCEMYPKVTTSNGKEVDSRLYIDLLNKEEYKYPRPFANLVYATYVTNTEKQMEEAVNQDGSPKYKKNSQGQFNVKDVVDFVGWDEAIGEISNIREEQERIGAIDRNGKKITYEDAEAVLNKVDHFNDTHKGLVASVQEHLLPTGENIYTIEVQDKTEYTNTIPIIAKQKLKAWGVYQQVLNQAGVDLKSIPADLKGMFSANNSNLAQQLKNLRKIEIKNTFKRDALALFYLDSQSQEVQRIVNAFGSIEDAAQALDDYNHNQPSMTQEQYRLISRALTHAKQMLNLDVDALYAQVKGIITTEEQNNPETAIKDTLHRLNKKNKISIDEIDIVNDKINSLSKATHGIIIQLTRRIRELYKEQGTNEEGRRLEDMVKKIEKEITTKHYHAGIIDFLGEAANTSQKLDELILNIPQTGDSKSIVFEAFKTLKKTKDIINQYLPIVNALAADALAMDEDISQADIDTIKERAKELTEFLNKKNNVINDLTERYVRELLRIAFNGKITESQLKNLMDNAVEDVSWADKWLHSVGTASNLYINALGNIIRNQELERDKVMGEYSRRIDVATAKLFKAGFNTKFMYEDQKHIISDINWKLYDSAKEAKIKDLAKKGFKGFAFKQALEDWIEQNTEERLVDRINKRKERVPNQSYRKQEDFQRDWSPEQKEYYDTMMQIKGELETLYPDNARNYYLPPQIRRNMVDGIVEAKSGKDVGRAIWNKVKDKVVIREDDTDYGNTNVINGEEVTFGYGNYDNTVKKEVPIHFQNPVEEGELLRDFSSGMSAYAGSAINYDSMMNIRDTAEALATYVGDKPSAAPNKMTEIVNEAALRITKKLYKYAERNGVSTVMTGFIDQHIYGMKKNSDGWLDKHKSIVKVLDSVRALTSFNGLAFNTFGAVANGLMGVMQNFIDAGCGEFFGFTDLGWAATKLFGETGTMGDIMELATNNLNHKGTLMQRLFDPMSESYGNMTSKRYHSNIFRNLISHDCSFIGYGIGEYYIHMLPMYAVLHKEKVLLNGKKISLFDAFEKVSIGEGNSKLELIQGVTDLDGNHITQDYIDRIKGKIKYVNSSMHGAMNEEDRGLIHQYVAGRMIMNFRQWMVGHYGRRFRGRYFDYNLGDWREGYYTTLWNMVRSEDTREMWNNGSWKVWEDRQKIDAVGMLLKDFATFMFRASTQWSNLNDMQKANVKRARAELIVWISLLGFSFALGEPDDHKKEYWRRWWIYQNKRMLLDTEASLPGPWMLNSFITILNSPMAGINTLNSLMYVFNGLLNGDILTEIQSGPHKGENKYIRNIIKYDLPFFKDYERLMEFGENDSLFKVFETTPSNH